MGPLPFTVLLVAAMMLFGRRSFDKLREAIDNFHDHFGGGPPTPMHPSPVNDGSLLRQRLRAGK